MSSEDDLAQEAEWTQLHDLIVKTLDRIGKKNAFREGDYWLLDDNWGWRRHQLEVQNLELLRPHVIKALQALLVDFPNWDMTVRVDVPGKENVWPGMGVVIYPNEIVDELQRDFLPSEFKNIRYD